MAKYATLSSLFTAIADAIRSKSGNTDKIIADDFPTAIENISSGFEYSNDKVPQIPEYCFYQNNELTNVVIPNAMFIYSYAFQGCKKLNTVSLSRDTQIDYCAFEGCTSLTNVIGGSIILSSGSHSAFESCHNLMSVPNILAVDGLGEKAFYECRSLTKIHITCYGSVSIGRVAFHGCSNLKNVILGEGLTVIDEDAFGRCSNLTNITLPNSLQVISDGAFYDCTHLKSIVIPNGVHRIGNGVFTDCANLKAFMLFNADTVIGSFVFPTNDRLSLYGLAGSTLEAYATENNITFVACDSQDISATEEDSVKAIFVPFENTLVVDGIGKMQDWNELSNVSPWCTNHIIENIIISTGVENIGSCAFVQCENLTNAVIPYGVIAINYGAFKGCTNLTSITIPDSVTSIGYEAFYNCTSLTNVTIGHNARSIGNEAFYYCNNLTSITIPDGVTSIGGYAFCRCTNLTSVIILGEVETVYTNTFSNTPIASGTGYIYVPATLVDAYKTADGWSTFANQIRAIEDYPEICGTTE